jgi:hypothetical protein
MDKLFGEIDYVAAREAETGTGMKKPTAYSSAGPQSGAPEKSIEKQVDVSEMEKETKVK